VGQFSIAKVGQFNIAVNIIASYPFISVGVGSFG